MSRIGITGHQSLVKRLATAGAICSEGDAWTWVEQVFAAFLTDTGSSGIVLISSLATGADQRLSRVGREQGSKIEVVVPSVDYVETLTGADRDSYDQLLGEAVKVIELGYPEPTEEAFFAAGKSVVDRSDSVVAVWDGKASEGLGGTADIVAYAQERGRTILHLDPIRRTISQSEKE